MLRPIVTWRDPDTPVSWRKLEEKMVQPWSLEDVLFSNVSNKQIMLRFGPLVSNGIRKWRLVEKKCKISCKWHRLSPLFNNKGRLIGGRPISSSHWSNSGIHYLKDLYNDTAIGSFQDIRTLSDQP